MERLRRFADLLTSPSLSLQGARDQVGARVQALIMLMMCASAGSSFVATLIVAPETFGDTAGLRWLSGGASVTWLVLYFVSRTRRFLVSVLAWQVLLPLLILAAVLNTTEVPVVFAVATSYLLVPIASAALVFNTRGMVLVLAWCALLVITAAQLGGLSLVYALPIVTLLVMNTGMILANNFVARASEREAASQAAAREAEARQRRRAEENSSRLNEVVERTNELIIAFSDDLRVLEANRAARSALALPEAGGSLEPFFPQSLARLEEAMKVARETGQWSGELPARLPNQPYTVLGGVLLAHERSDEREAFFSGIFRDTALERQLRHMERMDSLGQLAGGIAHDFNNTLSAILSSAEALQGSVTSDDEKEDVEIILSGASRSAQLTKKLLRLSRQTGVDPQGGVEVGAVLQDACRVLSRTLPPSIVLETHHGAAASMVRGDAVELEHVFLNLALNARDAMPGGGRLSFRTSNVEVDAVLAAASPPLLTGPHLLVEVADTGEGIDPAILERIFEPFFTTKGEGRGTGLGLASVYGTLVAHHGAVKVTSTPKQGTTFRLYLPLNDGSAREQTPEVTPAVSLRGVLLIDDDQLVRGATRRLLSSFSTRVYDAAGGEEGLALFQQHRADIELVVLDLLMPPPDGPATFERLRALAPDLPVVFISGFTRDIRVNELLQRPAVGFTPKPLQGHDVRAAIHAVLRGPR